MERPERPLSQAMDPAAGWAGCEGASSLPCQFHLYAVLSGASLRRVEGSRVPPRQGERSWGMNKWLPALQGRAEQEARGRANCKGQQPGTLKMHFSESPAN